jgi:prepilin-type N-terminal cleavage/methylation domain-containing protein
MKSPLKTKGFTLIEVLIALVILSVALLSLGGLMVQATKNNSFGGHMTEAVTFAQDKFEELKVGSWVAIIPGSDRKMGSNGIDYGRTWNVAINGNLKTITMTINWNDKTSHSINIISVVSH